MLNYSDRFYERQFITGKSVHHNLISQIEHILNEYFDLEKPLQNGLPTVDFIARQLNVSAHYLSDLLRSIIGQNAQQYVHSKLIEKAKEYLAPTNLSVSEIAYQLGVFSRHPFE
ncbi:helix-turn-helix domain-containing protein [Olivibacter domesticus]|uniref:Helix-turn-helix domain-containing protein n=1 Tax=Olivibacter domesticus TaxID=407022 RepID=A0A1H7JNH8_OLID1|nr:helix-turn-helix domain-containing protein [Olivibacter domesticus]SEK76132.1 Helix-turn-helix domain-containing protein [Olivibacter domesticus]